MRHMGCSVADKLGSMYNRWLYTSKSDKMRIGELEVPMLTEILFRVCDNDREKFEDVTNMLERAYFAGMSDGVHASFTAVELGELERKMR